MRRLVWLAVMGAPLSAGAASPAFTPPAGCEISVTIQSRACTVSHLYRCKGEPVGYQHRADFGADGLRYLGLIDAETQWIESLSPVSGYVERLLPNAADPASLSELLATGRDSFDFSTLTTGPRGDSFVMHYTGEDVLTGQSLMLGGQSLQQTRYEIVARDAGGQEAWRATGHEYVHPEWRSFLAGTRRVVTPEGTEEGDDSPLQFSFKGEAGFASTTPLFGCGDAVAFHSNSGRAAERRPQIFPS